MEQQRLITSMLSDIEAIYDNPEYWEDTAPYLVHHLASINTSLNELKILNDRVMQGAEDLRKILEKHTKEQHIEE